MASRPALRADTLDGLSRYDCASPQEEAVTIALLLRRKLETPGATAALVTPDRELARRVAAELRRWDIDIDDSAGLPLNRTPPGVSCASFSICAASELAPVPLAGALKHPLAAGGLAPERFPRSRRAGSKQAIRGPRPAPGFAGLRAALAGARRRRLGAASSTGSRPPRRRCRSCSSADARAARRGSPRRMSRPPSGWPRATPKPAPTRLWREAAGEAAARFCHELIDAARDFPPLRRPALSGAVRGAGRRRGRAAALTAGIRGWRSGVSLEARLQQADLVVLGGLNEGTWPAPAAHDPWMSRPMRREFGIAAARARDRHRRA